DIPANSIAAGNPARVIKPINPERHMLKREHIFAGSENYLARHDALDRYSHAQNTWRGWLRSVFMPGRDD
ncbi:MAG: acyltransferase, partial [Pseudomonadales bacterium]|nr:acyltransferase [Pseudomonadales bacterium]